MHIKRMLLVHYQTTATLEKIVLANIKSHCSFIHENIFYHSCKYFSPETVLIKETLTDTSWEKA